MFTDLDCPVTIPINYTFLNLAQFPIVGKFFLQHMGNQGMSNLWNGKL